MSWKPDVPLTRRTAIKAGAALGAAAGLFGWSAVDAATEVHGVKFDRVVNLVADYGADPTGNKPVDDAVKEAAKKGSTLIMVPDGTYQFSDEVFLSPPDSVGFMAEDGANPTFVPPDGFNSFLLNLYHMDGAIVKGIDIDITAPETTAGIRFDIRKRIHMEDVTYRGRGAHPDSDVTGAMNIELTDDDGVGVIKNVTAKKGSTITGYKAGDGRAAIFTGHGMRGTLTIKDCHFEEFGNNGVYASKTVGDVRVEGGVFRNNNVSQVRIAGEGSYVKDALTEVDLSKYRLERPDPDQRGYNTRCVVIEADEFVPQRGAKVINTQMLAKDADEIQATVFLADWAGKSVDPTFKDSTIVANGGARGLYAQGGSVTADNLVIIGKNAKREAIRLENDTADGSTIKNCCISRSGRNANGVVARNAENITVQNTNVNVDGDEVVEETGGSITQSDITTTGDCRPNTGDPSISVLEPTDIALSDATLAAEVQLAGADRGTMRFQWRRADNTDWNDTAERSIKDGRRIEQTIVGLTAGATYEYRAVLNAGGNQTTSSVTEFSTDANEGGPTFTTYSVDEADVQNDHAAVTVDWTVTDVDGNLDTMLLTLSDAKTDATLTSRGYDMNGEEASGTATLVAMNVPERELDVTATAIDTQNKATSRSKTVQE